MVGGAASCGDVVVRKQAASGMEGTVGEIDPADGAEEQVEKETCEKSSADFVH
jgi:hypothetical protein